MNFLNDLLSKSFPALGRPKRRLLAEMAHRSRKRDSYAQTGEDKIAIDLLKDMGLIGPIFYIDVGANHPTRLSNTYRMYREGSHGIVIEPNAELVNLHKKIRPRDLQLAVGCGKSNSLLRFYYSKTPVLSSFDQREVNDLWRTDILPVFTLDSICENLGVDHIDFLSIDVEGLDVEVLEGARNVLRKTRLVCIEANDSTIENTINITMAANDFKLKIKNGWNLFFVRA